MFLHLPLVNLVSQAHRMSTTKEYGSLSGRFGPPKKNVWSPSESREDWTLYLNNLRPEQVCWTTSWFHIGEVVIRGTNSDPLLLLDPMMQNAILLLDPAIQMVQNS